MPSDLLLVRVLPAADGRWQIDLPGEPARHYQSKYWALQAAELLACNRNIADGIATAVEVVMPDGDRVMWRRFRATHTAATRNPSQMPMRAPASGRKSPA